MQPWKLEEDRVNNDAKSKVKQLKDSKLFWICYQGDKIKISKLVVP